MARQKREISLSGVYHVMLRGVNKQRIFEHIEDYEGFAKILNYCLWTNTQGEKVETQNYDIYAYCFMDNHVHMLIGIHDKPIGNVVTRISGHYAQWFNHRYHRIGHLFQERFHSEVCDDGAYFMTLLDYIHSNPVKAGICTNPEDYPWSSFRELSHRGSLKLKLCSFNPPVGDINQQQIMEWCRDYKKRAIQTRAEVVGEAIQKGAKKDIKELKKVQKEHVAKGEKEKENEETKVNKITQWGLSLLCNLRQAKKISDVETLDKVITETLLGISGVQSMSEFQQLDKKTMRSALAIVRDAGISIRRLSRISGISEGIIRNCKNPQNYTKGTVPNV